MIYSLMDGEKFVINCLHKNRPEMYSRPLQTFTLLYTKTVIKVWFKVVNYSRKMLDSCLKMQKSHCKIFDGKGKLQVLFKW